MKIQCIVSGKNVNVSPRVFQSRADKAGITTEVLATSYVSRESKRLLREGKSVEDIRALSGVTGLAEVPADLVGKILEKKVKVVAAAVEATEIVA